MISVILPVRNEAQHIAAILEAVLAQDYPRDQVEILIADGMSSDGTRQVIQRYQQDHPNITLIDNPGRIVPTGMNMALRQARGDIIIRVDGHTIIAQDYISQCVHELLRTKADNVGGRMNAVGQTPFGEAAALATSSPFGIGGGRFHYSDQEEWVDTVYMGAWPKRVFEKIGLFDEELVRDQDDEFNYRLRSYGGKILLSPKIKSTYTVRSTPGALWNQYFQYGYYKVRVLQKHPRQMQPRQFIPPLFVLGLGVSILLWLTTPWGWLSLGLSGGSYLFANLATSALTASRKGWRHFPLLPVTFAIIHLGYGCGFISGMLRFWKRWGDKSTMVTQQELSHD